MNDRFGRAVSSFLLLPTVWVVDDNGGPGVNFTDIPPAVAAAADGDTILVRPGNYSAFTISGKGLQILGDSVTATSPASVTMGPPTTTITSVPLGALVVMERLTFGSGRQLVVSGPATRAVFKEVDVWPGYNMSLSSPRPGVLVEGAEALFSSCTISGFSTGEPWALTPSGPGLAVQNGGKVQVAGSRLSGGYGASCDYCYPVSPGAPAILLSSAPGALSRIWIADSTVYGGNGGYGEYTGASSPPGPGLVVDASFARISGDHTSSLVSGGSVGWPIAYLAAPGIQSSGSAVVQVHSPVSVQGVPSPTVGPGITLNLQPLPVLEWTGSPSLSGGSIAVLVSNGPPGAFFGIAVSSSPAFYGYPAPLGFLGEFLLAPPFFLLHSANLSPSGIGAHVIPLGGLPPSLAYFSFHFQAAALIAPLGTWVFSNAAHVTLKP